MIKFFRKIRYDLMEKNKTGKYVKYAIGEIVLVVIGILIALQVNNWNENRNFRKTQNRYLSQLEIDIDSMHFQYKGIAQYSKAYHDNARAVYNILKSCEISQDQKASFDQLLITFNDFMILFQIRDTYEEMLSANLLAGIEDKQFKSIVTEFFAQRDAMQMYINEFKQDLSLDYEVVKDHVTFGFNEMNRPTVEYDILQLCNSSDFTNAIFHAVRTRENISRMTMILLQKLESMRDMLAPEKHENTDS